jgi:hypothetical protein
MNHESMTIIILNDATLFPVPAAQHDRIIRHFTPIAEHGGGQMITPMGTMNHDLSLGQGDAIIIFQFNDIPVALAAVAWEEYASRDTWEALLEGHTESLPPGETLHPQLTEEPPTSLPWLGISFFSEFFDDINPENRREAVTVIWAMAMAILQLKRQTVAHN